MCVCVCERVFSTLALRNEPAWQPFKPPGRRFVPSRSHAGTRITGPFSTLPCDTRRSSQFPVGFGNSGPARLLLLLLPNNFICFQTRTRASYSSQDTSSDLNNVRVTWILDRAIREQASKRSRSGPALLYRMNAAASAHGMRYGGRRPAGMDGASALHS